MIIDYLDSALGQGTPHPNTSRGLQYSYKCPFCGDYKERLFVHPGRQTFYCHNCESAGSLVTFISDYAQIPWYDALKVYREYVDYDQILPDDLQQEIYTKLMSDIIQAPSKPKYVYPLPEEFVLLEEAKGKAGKQAIEYIKSRGITLKMAERYYIGYCAEGDYANRIIMPDFEQGELIYWQARTWLKAPKDKIAKKFYRKVMNPSLTEEQVQQGIKAVDKSEVLGNIDGILSEGVAVICEGKMDQYTIGDTGACLHGKHMSDEQFMKLVLNKDKIGALYIMLDGDAMKSAVATADRLYKHYDEVWMVKLPEDKDPNSLGAKGVLDCLTKAVRYNDMFQVRARLLGWF
ncbi:DNA primase [compost metagenome]